MSTPLPHSPRTAPGLGRSKSRRPPRPSSGTHPHRRPGAELRWLLSHGRASVCPAVRDPCPAAPCFLPLFFRHASCRPDGQASAFRPAVLPVPAPPGARKPAFASPTSRGEGPDRVWVRPSCCALAASGRRSGKTAAGQALLRRCRHPVNRPPKNNGCRDGFEPPYYFRLG